MEPFLAVGKPQQVSKNEKKKNITLKYMRVSNIDSLGSPTCLR